MYPKCAGGRFFFAIGSKSNTSKASLGSEIRLFKSRGAQDIGSGNLGGAAFCAKAGTPRWVHKVPATRNWRRRRRLLICLSCDNVIEPSPTGSRQRTTLYGKMCTPCAGCSKDHAT